MENGRREFVEEFGVMMDHMGSTRMLGRVWGALMVADPPELSAEELAEFLQASRGSISHATRQLIELGLIQRVSKPGVRRDYFRMRENAWAKAYLNQMRSLDLLVELFRQGLNSMEDASPEAQASLREAIDFYQFWQQEYTSLLERWNAYRETARV
jgi:DNA-binding transcriptional regulator GbsR (MarR family)